MSGRFAVKNEQCVKKSSGFWYGFRLGQCITDQVFKLTHDVVHRYVKNNSGIVLANLTAALDCLLYGTSAKHHTTAFDLMLLLWTKFLDLAKNKKCAFFIKSAE